MFVVVGGGVNHHYCVMNSLYIYYIINIGHSPPLLDLEKKNHFGTLVLVYVVLWFVVRLFYHHQRSISYDTYLTLRSSLVDDTGKVTCNMMDVDGSRQTLVQKR